MSGSARAKGMTGYRTLAAKGEAELVIQRSRFIGRGFPVESEAAALAILADIRKAHWDASHNCFAYRIGPDGGCARYSDDGEPGGTAGLPMMEVLKSRGLTDLLVVVTRYFGGILLGAGGLVRAYTQAVKEGLDHCETGIMRKGCELEVTTDYNDVGKLQYYFGQQGIVPVDSIYAENVKFILLVPVEKEDSLRKNLTETTCGKVKIEKLKETYFIDKE